MYCSQCGTPIHDKSKFCYKCGARVLTVPEPEEGQGGEAEERQSSRGSGAGRGAAAGHRRRIRRAALTAQAAPGQPLPR